MQQVKQVSVEAAGESIDPSVEVSGVQSLHQSLEDVADSFDVTGFKCPNDECGLAHMHDTTKHRLSDTFDVSAEETAQMDYNPVCHCGVHDAARNGSDLGINESEAAMISEDAPIPTKTERAMEQRSS